MEGNLAISSKEQKGVTVVSFGGRLDAVTAPGAEEKLASMIGAGSHKLLLDFRGVEYLSSAGMRMLLAITKKLRGVDGKLVLCMVNDNVMDVFKMSGFDHLLDITKDADEGLSRF